MHKFIKWVLSHVRPYIKPIKRPEDDYVSPENKINWMKWDDVNKNSEFGVKITFRF